CVWQMVRELDPLFRESGRHASRWWRSIVSKALRGFVCRNSARLHCEPACGTNRLAGWCPRLGGWENVGANSPKPCASVDAERSGERGWSVTFGARRAFSPLPQRTSDVISHTMAITVGKANADVNQQYSGTNRRRSRL